MDPVKITPQRLAELREERAYEARALEMARLVADQRRVYAYEAGRKLAAEQMTYEQIKILAGMHSPSGIESPLDAISAPTGHLESVCGRGVAERVGLRNRAEWRAFLEGVAEVYVMV